MKTAGFVLMLAALVIGVPAMLILGHAGRGRAAALIGVAALGLHALGNWIS